MVNATLQSKKHIFNSDIICLPPALIDYNVLSLSPGGRRDPREAEAGGGGESQAEAGGGGGEIKEY